MKIKTLLQKKGQKAVLYANALDISLSSMCKRINKNSISIEDLREFYKVGLITKTDILRVVCN